MSMLSPTALRTSIRRTLLRPTSHPLRRRTWTSLTRTKDSLVIHALGSTPFPYVWLRDACQEPTSIHPSTSQKLFRTSDIPVDISPLGSEGDANDGVRVTSDGIEVKWSDGVVSRYGREFLEKHSKWENVLAAHWEGKDGEDKIREESWTRKTVEGTRALFVPYASLDTPQGFVDATSQLARYGLVFVQGVPNEKTSGSECELKRLAEKLGEIRTTFYGETWDVVNLKSDSKNIAYTNLDLGLHMDLLYFQHPPRYQILHCLRNRVVGGTSVFVDALHAAQRLHQTSPEAFNILTQTPIAFHYINDGHHLHREHPTIELAPPSSISPDPSSSSTTPQIKHINYSPPFQAPLPLTTPQEFYPALKKFTDLLNDPENTYEYTLKEGDAVIFDNRRVLHARTAFHDKEGTEDQGGVGEPNRWLKGCYLEADAVLDRTRVLKTKLKNGLVA